MNRLDPPEPLSGVPEIPEIELAPGVPWLTVPELNRLLRRQNLAPALARAWLLDQLAQRVALPPEQEQQLLRQWAERQGLPAADPLEPWLQQQPGSAADLLARATAPARWRRWQLHRFSEEIEVHYLDRKPELDRVCYSLLRVSDPDQAQELYQRIKEGESDFAELSQRYSQGGERDTKGHVGPVPLASGHPELVSRLRVGRPGQLWPPFHVVNIWLVVRLEQLLPAELNEAMREQMMGELFQRWLEQRIQGLLNGEQPQLPEALP